MYFIDGGFSLPVKKMYNYADNNSNLKDQDM